MTHDLSRLKHFYSKVLIFPVFEVSEKSFRLQIGYSNIFFSQSYSSKPPFYHFAIHIPKNKFAEAKHWLSSRVKILSVKGKDQIFFEDWNAHALFFYDPAGNIVEFIAHHNLDNESSAKFTPYLIIGVGEIALPVPQIKAAYEQLHKQLSLKLWRGNLEQFAALGDEQGLIILVTLERGFISLGKKDKSEIFPLQMTIMFDRKGKVNLTKTPYIITANATSKSYRADV